MDKRKKIQGWLTNGTKYGRLITIIDVATCTSHRWFMHSSCSWSRTKIYFSKKKRKKKQGRGKEKKERNEEKMKKEEDWVERSRTYSLGKRNGGCNELVCSLLTNILFTNSEITRFLCSFAAWCTKIIRFRNRCQGL